MKKNTTVNILLFFPASFTLVIDFVTTQAEQWSQLQRYGKVKLRKNIINEELNNESEYLRSNTTSPSSTSDETNMP